MDRYDAHRLAKAQRAAGRISWILPKQLFSLALVFRARCGLTTAEGVGELEGEVL